MSLLSQPFFERNRYEKITLSCCHCFHFDDADDGVGDEMLRSFRMRYSRIGKTKSLHTISNRVLQINAYAHVQKKKQVMKCALAITGARFHLIPPLHRKITFYNTTQ